MKAVLIAWDASVQYVRLKKRYLTPLGLGWQDSAAWSGCCRRRPFSSPRRRCTAGSNNSAPRGLPPDIAAVLWEIVLYFLPCPLYSLTAGGETGRGRKEIRVNHHNSKTLVGSETNYSRIMKNAILCWRPLIFSKVRLETETRQMSRCNSNENKMWEAWQGDFSWS